MTVTIRLFAMYREVAGTSELAWSISQGDSVGDLWQSFVDAHPKLPKIQPSAAVNKEFVRFDHVLAEGDVVAFLPPVSGGAGSVRADGFELTSADQEIRLV